MNKNFIVEFKHFVSRWLLPLLGIDINENDLKDYISLPNKETNFDYIDIEDNNIIFGTKTKRIACFEYEEGLSKDNLSLARVIIQAFLKVSKYSDRESGNPQMNYVSDMLQDVNYAYAIEYGICGWIIGESMSYEIEKLFRCLEDWSQKTYEGNNVSFGIIIDREKESVYNKTSDKRQHESIYSKYGNFLDFLKDDYGAVLSDGITSIIEVDDKCNFLNYYSITENNKIKGCELENNLPYRFASTIHNYVVGDKIGVFLLRNGDIIISKKQEVRFIKRNSKWLNFSVNAFKNILKDIKISNALLSDIFVSAIDVSLSHCGGIIAVIDDISKIYGNGNNTLNKIDNILEDFDFDLLYEEEISKFKKSQANLDKKERSIKKRLLKRGVLLQLLKKKNISDSFEGKATCNFSEIDRRLRTELISLDGACIMLLDGTVCSFGAIVQNESGSSGGGRGAAAEKLSSFSGFAIKISTDGYIEVYKNKDLVYSIK